MFSKRLIVISILERIALFILFSILNSAALLFISTNIFITNNLVNVNLFYLIKLSLVVIIDRLVLLLLLSILEKKRNSLKFD